MIEAQPWTTRKEYDIAIKEHEVELAQIDMEEVLLMSEDLEDAVADAQIVSPIDGVLLTIPMSEGKVVNAYDTVAIVADLGDLEVSVELERYQLERLSEGMAVNVSMANEPGVEIGGEIRKLPYPYGGGSKDVVGGDNYSHIELNTSEIETGFELGDLVRVTVVLERKEDVIWIPPQAIRTFEGRNFVLLQDGEVQRRVDVKLGIQGDDRVEIIEGLFEGQIVVGP
jgi:RND family efflux transporter MFP subunit